MVVAPITLDAQHEQPALLHPETVMELLQRYQLMPQVLRALVIDRALASQSCSEAETAQAIAQFKAQQRITTPDEQATWLQRHQMTEPQQTELALRPVLLEKFKHATWEHQIESHFLRRKRDLDQVMYSLIRTKDFGLANELYFRIREGEQTFAEVAQQHSQGPEAQSNGLLGPIPLSQPHPALAKFLASSQPGHLCTPQVLGEWVVIVRLEKRIPVTLDAAMRQRMLDELFEQWIQDQIATHSTSA
jgi:parvulin-like peptidyl-prolyl isomerase